MAATGQALIDQIARLGLTDRVTLAGVQPARAMFARGRCAVVPSLAESLPYVVLEAAAARLPVISTRVGGIPEIFGPTAASLIPANDAGALRAAMTDVLDHPDRGHGRDGRRASSTSRRAFRWPAWPAISRRFTYPVSDKA